MFLQIGPPESPKQESMPPRNQLDEVFFGEDFFGLYQYLVGSVYFDNLLFLAASLSVVKRYLTPYTESTILILTLPELPNFLFLSFKRDF